MESLVGQTVHGYEIRECLSIGTYAVIYKAYELKRKRYVAVKRTHPDYVNNLEMLKRFQYEAMISSRLNSPRIVKLYDYWRDDDGPWLSMQWLAGGSLRDQINKGPIAPLRMVQILLQIAEGLNIAHRRSIVHRDVKPGNILLDKDGNAVISDFGIAKHLKAQSHLTTTDSMMGSPAYLSPEQIQKVDITPRTDIYILGIVLYEALTGQYPFGNALSKLHLILKHLREPLPHIYVYNPGLPETINYVIQKATSKNPENRYPNVLKFSDAFRKAVMG